MDLIESLKDKKKIKVLFVCLGNICRSPAAQGVLEHIVKARGDSDNWTIDSAGTYGGHAGQLPDKRMRIHAQHRGYNLEHRARRIQASDFEDFDVIVAMDNSNYDDLKRIAPTCDNQERVVRMIDFITLSTRFDYVPDPYYEGAEGFELVLDLLENGCENLYKAIKHQTTN